MAPGATVRSSAPFERVGVTAARQSVFATPTHKPVDACPSADPVGAAMTPDPIVAAQSDQDVVSRRAVDPVPSGGSLFGCLTAETRRETRLADRLGGDEDGCKQRDEDQGGSSYMNRYRTDTRAYPIIRLCLVAGSRGLCQSLGSGTSAPYERYMKKHARFWR